MEVKKAYKKAFKYLESDPVMKYLISKLLQASNVSILARLDANEAQLGKISLGLISYVNMILSLLTTSTDAG